jgi:hypothetical protein
MIVHAEIKSFALQRASKYQIYNQLMTLAPSECALWFHVSWQYMFLSDILLIWKLYTGKRAAISQQARPF